MSKSKALIIAALAMRVPRLAVGVIDMGLGAALTAPVAGGVWLPGP